MSTILLTSFSTFTQTHLFYGFWLKSASKKTKEGMSVRFATMKGNFQNFTMKPDNKFSQAVYQNKRGKKSSKTQPIPMISWEIYNRHSRFFRTSRLEKTGYESVSVLCKKNLILIFFQPRK